MQGNNIHQFLFVTIWHPHQHHSAAETPRTEAQLTIMTTSKIHHCNYAAFCR